MLVLRCGFPVVLRLRGHLRFFLYWPVKKQLEYLAKRVKILQRLTKRICKDKIASFA